MIVQGAMLQFEKEGFSRLVVHPLTAFYGEKCVSFSKFYLHWQYIVVL